MTEEASIAVAREFLDKNGGGYEKCFGSKRITKNNREIWFVSFSVRKPKAVAIVFPGSIFVEVDDATGEATAIEGLL